MEGTDSVDLRTTYLGLQLSSPIVASADRSRGTRGSQGARRRGSRRRRPAVAVRGGDNRRGGSDSHLHSKPVASTSPRRSTTSPTVSNFTSEADRYLELLEEIKKQCGSLSSPV